ncbi:YihY/virulence factor BrkB family protein [Pseudooctadecabacter sp.]|uniref:YihY/virulence factor BrkB family protein n=1 Tax=Pseudooctadecabacter sp. TaxID=1966338 RepID=UPI0025E1C84C|nr:YihY/virulence factor BrkB family protein [Pseudooctadecabacter sp.]
MWREIYEVIRQVLDDLGEKNAGLISAGVAFYGLFAIFPGLAATIALFGLVADPVVVNSQLNLVRGLMPPEVFDLFEGQISAILNARSETLGVATAISVGVALWSVRAGVAALIQGINAIFERPNRGIARHMLVALLMSASLVGVAIVALLMVVVAPVVLALAPFNADQEMLLELLRWIVVVLVMLAGLGIIYRYGPNRRGHRLGWFTPGAFLVVVLWIGMSVAFSVYVANFGNYNEVYGSLGAVIVLLFWFYLSSFLIMVGAAVNVALDRRKPL